MLTAQEKLARAIHLASLELEAIHNEDIDEIESLCNERAILQAEALSELEIYRNDRAFELALLELQGKLIMLERAAFDLQKTIKKRLNESQPQAKAMRGYNKIANIMQ